MGSQHTAMLEIPELCRRAGLNVVELDGWDTAQGDYKWTRENGNKSYSNAPSGFILHGSAGTVARPVVKDSRGKWSVAGAWTGLDDGTGRLTTMPQTGKLNRPTIYFCSSGPARYSAGYGYPPALEDMFDDIRPPLDARGSDSKTLAANRYTFNVENVHPNDGSAIDPGVWDHLLGLIVIMHDHFGWEERLLGHRSWTKRKPVDPWFVPGGLEGLQDAVQVALDNGLPPTIPPPIQPPIEPPDPGDIMPPTIKIGRDQLYIEQGQEGQDVEFWQTLTVAVVTEQLPEGNSNKTFITTHAPELTWKVWDQAMTDYLSAWTRRNSYGIGATERRMILDAYIQLHIEEAITA